MKFETSALANTICLAQEDKSAFDRLLRAYLAEYNPVGLTETHLVEELAICRWRTYRAASIEAVIIGVEADRQDPSIARSFKSADNSTRIGLAFESRADRGNALSLLTRYDARLNRQYRYALRELRALQAGRKQKLPNNPTDLDGNKQAA